MAVTANMTQGLRWRRKGLLCGIRFCFVGLCHSGRNGGLCTNFSGGLGQRRIQHHIPGNCRISLIGVTSTRKAGHQPHKRTH